MEILHATVVKFITYLNCVCTLPGKIKTYIFAMIHKTQQCTFDSNSVKSYPISIIFAVPKREKCTKQGMHLLIYSSCASV